MKKLSKLLNKLLKIVLADIRSAIIGAIVLFYLSAAGTILLKRNIYNVLQKPIPLWLVIVILLSILFCCLILFLIRSSNPSIAPEQETLREVNNFKWMVHFTKNSYLRIEGLPYCKIHNTQFIPSGTHVFKCPENECTFKITEYDLSHESVRAESIIKRDFREKIIR